MLVSAVQQCESAVCIDIYIPSLLNLLPKPLPIPPLYVITEHQAELPVLHGGFPLAIYFIHGSIYLSKLFDYCHDAYNHFFLFFFLEPVLKYR